MSINESLILATHEIIGIILHHVCFLFRKMRILAARYEVGVLNL